MSGQILSVVFFRHSRMIFTFHPPPPKKLKSPKNGLPDFYTVPTFIFPILEVKRGELEADLGPW